MIITENSVIILDGNIKLAKPLNVLKEVKRK